MIQSSLAACSATFSFSLESFWACTEVYPEVFCGGTYLFVRYCSNSVLSDWKEGCLGRERPSCLKALGIPLLGKFPE